MITAKSFLEHPLVVSCDEKTHSVCHANDEDEAKKCLGIKFLNRAAVSNAPFPSLLTSIKTLPAILKWADNWKMRILATSLGVICRRTRRVLAIDYLMASTSGEIYLVFTYYSPTRCGNVERNMVSHIKMVKDVCLDSFNSRINGALICAYGNPASPSIYSKAIR